MCPTFSLSDMTKGIFPIISITANKTKLAVKISFASITLIFFCKSKSDILIKKSIIIYFYKKNLMILVKDTLISDDVLSEEFACNISKCKGECCVAGEAGAPLKKKRLNISRRIIQK